MMGMPGVTNTSQFRLLISTNSSSFWETRSEHWRFALRLFLGGLVVEHIPVFLKPVFDSHNVGSNPIYRRTAAAESPVRNYIIPFGHNPIVLVLQCVR